MEISRDQLLLKLGAAKAQFPAAWRLMTLRYLKKLSRSVRRALKFKLRRQKLRQVRRREGLLIAQ